MELYKVSLPMPKLQRTPHPAPPTPSPEDGALVCISFVTCGPGGGFLSAARVGVRPRDEAPAGAFGRDSSLPRGPGEVLATVRWDTLLVGTKGSDREHGPPHPDPYTHIHTHTQHTHRHTRSPYSPPPPAPTLPFPSPVPKKHTHTTTTTPPDQTKTQRQVHWRKMVDWHWLREAGSPGNLAVPISDSCISSPWVLPPFFLLTLFHV